MERLYVYKSPVGDLFCTMSANGFCRISFEDPATDEGVPLPDPYAAELQEYFRGRSVPLNWTVDLRGTEFQRSVWRMVQTVGFGQTTTYKRIADALGTKGYRAVGQAVGRNPVLLVVPCHRVLGTHGLGGFGGGLALKQLLLELETALPRDYA